MDTDNESYILRDMLRTLGLKWEDLENGQVQLDYAGVITETFSTEEIIAAEKMLTFYLECRDIALSLTSVLRDINALKTKTERTINELLVMQSERFADLQKTVKTFGHYAYLELVDYGQKSESSICAHYNRPSTLKIATAFDPKWSRSRRMFSFDLPDELDMLEKFIRHDQELLKNTLPHKGE